VIRVSDAIVAETLAVLRNCGDGERECVVFWTADWDDDVAGDVVHPPHTSGAFGYKVDDAWLNPWFKALATAHQRVVTQVHSHPAAGVRLSETDDNFVITPSIGFLSIVVPDFGADDSVARWGIWQLEADDRWRGASEQVQWKHD